MYEKGQINFLTLQNDMCDKISIILKTRDSEDLHKNVYNVLYNSFFDNSKSRGSYFQIR